MAEEILGSSAKILAAARKLFAQKGFENTSVDELAEEAQVAKGTIYVHFSGKDEILFAVIKQSLDEMRKTITELINNKQPFLERFHRYIREVLRLFENNKDIFRIITTEKVKLMQEGCLADKKTLLIEEHRKANLILAEFLEQGMKEKVVKQVDAGEAALVLQAIIQSFVFQWFISGFSMAILDKADVIADYFLNGILEQKKEGG